MDASDRQPNDALEAVLDRLARRVEARAAEIRDGSESSEGIESTSWAKPAAAADDESRWPEATPDLGPPSNDHTPAWGRLAELSARFESTLDRDLDTPGSAGTGRREADPDEEQADDLFAPHADLGTVAADVGDEDSSTGSQAGGGANGHDPSESGSVGFVIQTQIPGLDIPADDTPHGGEGGTGQVLRDAAERLQSSDSRAAVHDDPPALAELAAFESGDGEFADVEIEQLVPAANLELLADREPRQVDELTYVDAGPVRVGPTHTETSDAVFDGRRSVVDRDPGVGSPQFSDAAATPIDGVVRQGPLWYRRRIEQFGVVAGLVPMVALGTAAALALAVRAGTLGGWIGLVLGTSAAPGLLVAGAPFANSNAYPYAAVGSIPIWLLLGWIARRRTLQRPAVDWRDYAIQLGWLTLAVVVGATIALVFAATRLGGSLL